VVYRRGQAHDKDSEIGDEAGRAHEVVLLAGLVDEAHAEQGTRTFSSLFCALVEGAEDIFIGDEVGFCFFLDVLYLAHGCLEGIGGVCTLAQERIPR
jgi:hypothetical protein